MTQSRRASLTDKLTVLDLFAGIGGFSLGLERTGGFETVAFCEIDPYCRAVLRKHWPNVRQFEDVRTLTAADVGPVDVISGGFPCQDISNAGKRAGIEGERSGLWSEYARLIGELRPRFVIVENVAALLGRGLGRVLGDLAAIGFDAEWHCIPASAVGAPHRRDRLWIIAYAAGGGPQGGCIAPSNGKGSGPRAFTKFTGVCDGDGGEVVADATGAKLQGVGAVKGGQQGGFANSSWWVTEPDVGRVANGVPSRVDRLRALGNAVVPQVVEIIGCAILQAQGRLT